MNPRLIAASGPLAGQTFTLGTERLTLGRDHGNMVHLRDLAASRQHCVLEAEDESFRLRDLDSRQGTFVNGVPIVEQGPGARRPDHDRRLAVPLSNPRRGAGGRPGAGLAG